MSTNEETPIVEDPPYQPYNYDDDDWKPKRVNYRAPKLDSQSIADALAEDESSGLEEPSSEEEEEGREQRESEASPPEKRPRLDDDSSSAEGVVGGKTDRRDAESTSRYVTRGRSAIATRPTKKPGKKMACTRPRPRIGNNSASGALKSTIVSRIFKR